MSADLQPLQKQCWPRRWKWSFRWQPKPYNGVWVQYAIMECADYLHNHWRRCGLCSSKWHKTHTFSLMPSFLRLRHISVVLMCCRVSLANRKRSFSSRGAAEAQAAAPKRHLSSSICFNIPEEEFQRSWNNVVSVLHLSCMHYFQAALQQFSSEQEFASI